LLKKSRAIREEVINTDADRRRQFSLVNKAVEVMLKILMEVKPSCTHADTKEESDNFSLDDLVDEDSEVDSRSVQSLYYRNQARLICQEESDFFAQDG